MRSQREHRSTHISSKHDLSATGHSNGKRRTEGSAVTHSSGRRAQRRRAAGGAAERSVEGKDYSGKISVFLYYLALPYANLCAGPGEADAGYVRGMERFLAILKRKPQW